MTKIPLGMMDKKEASWCMHVGHTLRIPGSPSGAGVDLHIRTHTAVGAYIYGNNRKRKKNCKKHKTKNIGGKILFCFNYIPNLVSRKKKCCIAWYINWVFYHYPWASVIVDFVAMRNHENKLLKTTTICIDRVIPREFTHWNSFFYVIQENWCQQIFIKWKYSTSFKIMF